MGDPSLICEALVREIRDAQRWSAVEEAWQALLNVRRMSREMAWERNHLRGAYQSGSARRPHTEGDDGE